MSNSSFFSGTGITATQSTAIETSVDAAGTSATNAAASALLASQKAALATDKSNTAAGFANASEVSKDASVVAKNSAATSATNAASSASTANTTKNDVTALKNATQVLHDATEVFKNTANTKANEASASAAVASTKEGLATTAASATSGSASAAATSAAASNQAKIAALAAQADAEDAESVAIANAALALSRQQLASTAASQALGYRNEAASASSANTAATASANAAAASATTALAAKNAALLITGNYLGAHSSAPTTATGGGSLVIGMLYFNTTTNVMMVYGSGGWGAAGSSVNGTSERKTYIATANQTTFAATYDSGFVDIWQNGAKLYVTDFTATNGSTIVLASGATVGDTIEIVAFGTFSVANQTFAGTTTVANLVVTGSTNLGSTDLTTTGKMLYSNLYSAVSDLPSASTYHGMFAHVHATGLAYYAHAGAWVALSRASDVPTNAAIRSAVEAASDSNVFTDADHSKLNAIEASATADQTKSDIEGLGIDLPAANLTGTIAAARLSTATTQAESDDSTKIATTAYVVDKITTLIGGAPSTLNDLNELAAAINDDADYNSTLTTALATKLPLAGGAVTGNVTFGDSNKAIFGAGSDLQIYHDGTRSYVDDAGAGSLWLRGGDVAIKSTASETMADFANNGAVTLYHDNAAKIATSSGGVTVTGNIANSSGDMVLDVAGDIILDAGGSDIKLKAAGTEFGQIYKETGGNLAIYASIADKSIRFQGLDGSSVVNALTLDMENAGAAAFNSTLNASGLSYVNSGNGSGVALKIGGEGGGGLKTQYILASGHTNYQIGVATHAASVFSITPSTSAGNTTFTNPALNIDASGNVGIGQVPATDWSASYDALQVGAQGVMFAHTSGGGDASTWITNNAYVSTGGWKALSTNEASHYQQKNGGHSWSNAPSVSAGAGLSFTDRMRLDSVGTLMVDGTTKVSHGQFIPFQVGQGTNFFTIQRNNGIDVIEVTTKTDNTSTRTHYNLQNANGTVGTIQTQGSGVAYNTSSDYRLKENVDYDWDATTRLKQLKPARFNFIADADTTVDGFLAHEAQAVVPECVTGVKDAMKDEEYEVTAAVEEVTDDDGNVTTEAANAVMGTRSVPDMQGIDQAKLVPLLVKTIIELEARITALEA